MYLIVGLLQAFWRAWRCRSHMCTIWQAEFDALSEATKAQQLRPLHRLFSLFHRVYRPHDPACLHVLARVCEAVAAVQDNKLLFASCSGEELDRACLHVSRICTATLRTLQHQGCVPSHFMSSLLFAKARLILSDVNALTLHHCQQPRLLY